MATVDQVPVKTAKGQGLAKKKGADAHDIAVRKKLDAIGPELYPTYQELEKKLNNNTRDRVYAYHDIGKVCLKISKDYEKQTAEMFAKQLGLSPTDLYAAMRLVKFYPMENDIAELVSRRNGLGKPLNWSQIRLIMQDRLNKVREDWIIKTLEGN
jgi:hypothetical protein